VRGEARGRDDHVGPAVILNVYMYALSGCGFVASHYSLSGQIILKALCMYSEFGAERELWMFNAVLSSENVHIRGDNYVLE